MRGDETLWVPGEDHAGIATQTVVERQLLKEGTDRHEIGRAAFIERVWQWVQQYKNRIQDQHRRLGVSCDWSRERSTLTRGWPKPVLKAFLRPNEEGLTNAVERTTTCCPACTGALP